MVGRARILFRRLSLNGSSRSLPLEEERWRGERVAAMREFQLAKLRSLWTEAIANVPYYQDLVSSGQACRDFRSIDQFRAEVPVLTREMLGREAERFRRATPPHHYLATGGSTGTPVRLGCWKGEGVASAGLNQWVGRMANGMKFSDPVALIWGHIHLLGSGVKGRINHQVRAVKDFLLGYLRVNAYQMGMDDALKGYRAIRRFRPKVVIGYAAALDLWARHCIQQGLTLSDIGVRLCVACSEVFPQQDSRTLLSEFLGAPVVMEYGGVDFGVCAYELWKENRYRVFWNTHFLEASEGGALVVTSLTPRYLPLFRYRNGDECDDPSVEDGGVTSFAAIRGRIDDLLRMPDGRCIHSVGIFHCIHQEPVSFIQLVRRPGQMVVRLAAERLPEESQLRIRARLSRLHPDLGRCEIQVVNDVTANRAGKRRWIVDEAQPPAKG